MEPDSVEPNYWKFLQSRQVTALQKAIRLMQLENRITFDANPAVSKGLEINLDNSTYCRRASLDCQYLDADDIESLSLMGTGFIRTGTVCVACRRDRSRSIAASLGDRSMLSASSQACLVTCVHSNFRFHLRHLNYICRRPVYWKWHEKYAWEEAQTNPSYVSIYAYMPAKYKRREAYEFLAKQLEKRAERRRTESDLWLDDDIQSLIDEIDKNHPDDAEIQGLKPRLQAILAK